MIDSNGRKKVFASLFQHRRFEIVKPNRGAHRATTRWESRTIFPPTLAEPRKAVPSPCWFCSNEEPELDFESTVSADRSKTKSKGPYPIITYEVEPDTIPPGLRADHGKLVVELQDDDQGALRYQVYWLKNWDPKQKSRVPTAEELVGESDWSESRILEPWTIQWLQNDVRQIFNDQWDEIKKKFAPIEQPE